MKFDMTGGKRAVYLVSLYGVGVEDFYYFHYYKDAKEMFNRLKGANHKKGTIISVYDLIHDLRKDFARA